MWATGICSLTAVRAPASVEFVSPGTTAKSGFCFCSSFSRRSIIFAVCWAWVPLPTFKFATGSGRFSSSKKIFVIS